MDVHIETERLYIRELLPSDEEGMYEMDSNPEVHRYLGNKPYKTIDESRNMIALIRQQYQDNGIGRWAVIEKASGDFIGWTGFRQMRERVNGHIDYYDFGYRQMRRHWGKGFAYEAGLASLSYGLEVMGLQSVHAMTDIDNGASRHLLEKLGFTFVKIFCYDSHPTWREQGQLTTWYKHGK